MGRPRKPERAIKTSITIEPRLFAQAQARCASTGESLSRLIARALERELNDGRDRNAASTIAADIRRALDKLESLL